VVSFERIYGMELRKRGIAPPPQMNVRVSGAAGGTVLDPLPGFFPNVAVFDFRSLYPTIMRTFNIDPLSHERLPSATATLRSPPEKAQSFANGAAGIVRPSVVAAQQLPPITAPNGAVFSREPGVLPALIAEYFAARRKALDAGDTTAAGVYKILMNSFYGVLGTAACRYGRTELAGAITSFARKWLLLSRDWFTEKGYRVLYGDTDSLFVETGLGDGAAYSDFLEHCGALAQELNQFLTERIRAEYQLDSCIELRFEKAYRRLLVPPLRGIHEGGEIRGRAKGYGGYLLREDGGAEVEVKGMEAVRSDVTPLARRFQLELLELVFAGNSNTDGGAACDEAALKNKVLETLKDLRSGKLDDELVYRKRLSRPPEAYTSSTPPQVKAARALGWKGRRGPVEYVWTLNGPEPASLPHAALDYDHYTDSQVLPVARSIAAALGWHTEIFPQKGRSREALESGQMELGL
jgi:DNA polymerase-2